MTGPAQNRLCLCTGPYAFRYTRGGPGKRNAPIPEDERAYLEITDPLDQAAICDLATTDLRHGLSTAIASTEAKMFAPAATMNTLSQVPEDCCM